MKTLGALVLLLAFSPVSGREVESLDGIWDLRPAGEEGWREARVPAAFETVLGLEFDGVAEYRRRFTAVAPAPGEVVSVRFAAVMTRATVWFNSRELGSHLGGWTPFAFELPAAAWREGAQELLVRVDELVGHDTQGFLPIIQPHFGGIWQGVTLRRRVVGRDLDPDLLELRPVWVDGTTRLEAEAGCELEGSLQVEVFAGDTRIASGTPPLDVPARPWSPTRPQTYRVVCSSVVDGKVVDRIERRTAWRRVEVRGRKILLNGEPLVVRGVLHWGYEPPLLAPSPSPEVWREEMRWARSCGFNLIKACLWMPPPAFFEIALEEGLLVWQEYPAWHPDFSPAHRDALLAEYDELFRADRRHPAVVVRSLTCETGHSADAGVVEALFRRCKEVTGGALVEDDSSWISWNRFHDFYDDHSYGNCAPWLDRLRGFDEHIRANGAKPLLLGEAITADTWIDLDALDAALASGDPWWRPFATDDMRQFEGWLAQQHGAGAAERLVPDSLRYAMLARKYQIEAMRRALPDAGYVASVMRDFRKARMGFFDDLGRAKWDAADFAWHGARMLVLEDARAIRSVAAADLAAFRPAAVVAGPGGGDEQVTVRVDVAPGGAEDARQCQVTATAPGLSNSWDFWVVPDAPPEDPPLREGIVVATEVDEQLLSWVEGGGRLLLLAGGRGSPRNQGLWFLRGAPFAPLEHPLFARVPRGLLLDLQPFDLDGSVVPLSPLVSEFDIVLGFWDTHDQLERVQRYALLAEARMGEGRILLTSLGVDQGAQRRFAGETDAPDPARAWLRHSLVEHLAHGPAARSALSAKAVSGWKRALGARRVELDGEWLLQPDPDDLGIAEGWADPAHPDADWIRSHTRSHWEAAGLPNHDGVAWYRKHFTPPDWWSPSQPLFAVFDGVDDSYQLSIGGERVAAFGDPATGETVWLVRTFADISAHVVPGENVMALRVVDHVGAGGLHRAVWLSNAEPGAEDLLQR